MPVKGESQRGSPAGASSDSTILEYGRCCLPDMKHTRGLEQDSGAMPVYLDCNATAPLDPSVKKAVTRWLCEEIGNAGSRTHVYGLAAKRAVQAAREQVASVVDARDDEVIFTSGATESNNIAILGLAQLGHDRNRRHVVSTEIEHKAVLEPLESLSESGFEVTLLKPDSMGMVSPDSVEDAIRPDTLLVTVMHANNETGVIQPVSEIASRLKGHAAFLHVDAAQGFGKDLDSLRSQRIDLISVSSHKIYGPVGVGALVARRRGYSRAPLRPLAFGGGQEAGLRPGTVPVPLVVGLGVASEIAERDAQVRAERTRAIRDEALQALSPLGIRLHSNLDHTLSHVINFSVPDVDSEAIILAVKDLAAVSNGSACTSQRYSPSHVLTAMGLPEDAVSGAVRLSWCHMTSDVDWPAIAARIDSLR